MITKQKRQSAGGSLLLQVIAIAVCLLGHERTIGGAVEAFVPSPTPSKPVLLPRSNKKTSSSQLDALPRKLITSLLEHPTQNRGMTVAGGSIAFPTLFFGGGTPPAIPDTSSALASTSTLLSLDPGTTQEASHFFAELSHVGLDLATFLFGGTGMVALRSAAVLGRICAILADYLPDHVILADELVFQAFMLTVSFFALLQAALPAAATSLFLTKLSLRDGKAFAKLFGPSGTTWSQFKALLSVQALDWVDLEQVGDVTTTTTDEYIYWVYNGSVTVQETLEDGSLSSRYNVSASRQDAGRGLVGERRLLRRLKDGQRNNNKKDTTVSLTATAANTTLLRIHTGNLRLLMDNDQQLAESIRSLLFSSMEAKLDAAQQQQQEPAFSSVNA